MARAKTCDCKMIYEKSLICIYVDVISAFMILRISKLYHMFLGDSKVMISWIHQVLKRIGNLKFISLHRSAQLHPTKCTFPVFISLHKSTRSTDKPIHRKLQIYRINKNTFQPVINLKFPKHTGQLLFPDLASTLWLKQNGHFRKLSIMSCFSLPHIKPFTHSFNFAGLVCP